MKASHIVTGISICLNVALAGFLWHSYQSPPFDAQAERTYKYLSKRIFISDQNDLLVNFVPLREKLSKYMDPLKHKVSVYFEYLPTGNSIGIHDKEEFIPASLLKMPLAMGAKKKIEDGKIDPNEDIVLNDQDIDPRFG
ncbi:serine hydrolase, partial [Candidatus Microgenomates bacterium]|nr:serine hydrolase [Candidatus Microgenomates bacterium]